MDELGPFLADEQEQRNELLAFGEVDLNPSSLTLATLEEKLKTPVLKQPGDFDTTRLGWACGKERCAIWATFFVPLAQEIPPNAVPASLIVKSPLLGDFSNIGIGELRLGESDQKLVERLKYSKSKPRKVFRVVPWDTDWSAAWTGVDGKVFELVFANVTLQRRFLNQQKPAPAGTK